MSTCANVRAFYHYACVLLQLLLGHSELIVYWRVWEAVIILLYCACVVSPGAVLFCFVSAGGCRRLWIPWAFLSASGWPLLLQPSSGRSLWYTGLCA